MNYDNYQELVELLKEIDRLLLQAHGKQRVKLYIFGGAAAVAGYGVPRATVDIDFLIESEEIEKKILEWGGQSSPLAVKHGVYMQSANTVLMLLEEDQWRKRSRKILPEEFQCLDIRVLSVEDLILSKLGRYSDKDRADIKFLLEKHPVKPESLIECYRLARSYYVGNLRMLDSIFNVILKEHFNLPPAVF